jgi:hypothetical protein
MYEPPVLTTSALSSVEEAEAWWVVPLAIVAAFGGAWAWCKSMCGSRGVRSCSTSYWKMQVKAVCR